MFFHILCIWPVQTTPSPYQRKSEQELLSNTNLGHGSQPHWEETWEGFKTYHITGPSADQLNRQTGCWHQFSWTSLLTLQGKTAEKWGDFSHGSFPGWYCGICPLFQISEHLRDWFYQPMARSLPANMCEQLVFRTLTQPSSVQTGFVLSWRVCVTGRDGQRKGQHSRDKKQRATYRCRNAQSLLLASQPSSLRSSASCSPNKKVLLPSGCFLLWGLTPYQGPSTSQRAPLPQTVNNLRAICWAPMGQRANDSSLTCPRKRPPLSTDNQRPNYLLNRGEPLGRHTLDKLELV